MECFYCSGEMKKSATTHTVELGERIIAIRHVPCYQCTKCAEIVFTGSVVERLEQITMELEKSLKEVSVVNYSVA